MTFPKISIGSWAYAIGPYAEHPVGLEEVADRLATLAFDRVELGGLKPHAHPDLYPDKKKRRELMEMLWSKGLEVPAYAADLWSFPFAAGDSKVAKQYETMFDRSLEFCIDCGIKAIRIDTVVHTPFPANIDHEAAWDRVVNTFRNCADKAAQVNTLVVWEFEPGFIFNKPREVIGLFNAVDRPNFKLLFDTCHAHMCSVVAAKQTLPLDKLSGGEIEFIHLLKDKIGHVHLIDSDNTLHDNETSTHTPFGQGVLDFEALLPALVESGYNSDWWSIDLCFWPNAWDITTHCKKYLDNLFTKLNWK